MKSVKIRSYFWSVFSCIRTEYGDLRSKFEYSPNTGKHGPEITPYLDNFHAVTVVKKYHTKKNIKQNKVVGGKRRLVPKKIKEIKHSLKNP